MDNPQSPVGFDYKAAVERILTRLNYREITDYCGYEDQASIRHILRGAIPSHPQGEAIWALHMQLFNEKPPMSLAQSSGRYGFKS